MPITIDIINATSADSVLTDADLEVVVNAIQDQLDHEFVDAWGIAVLLNFVPRGTAPNDNNWWVVALDNSDVQGALGYHDLTNAGLPCGKFFVDTCKQYGTSWTVDLDHEILEMIVDPDVNQTVLIETRTGNELFAYEVGDPVQSDACGYEATTRGTGSNSGQPINLSDGTPVLLSDFVYPAWFETFWNKGQAKFDHTDATSQPFEIAPNGYASVFKFKHGKWSQIFGDRTDRSYDQVPKVGTRRERRARDRDAWMTSAVDFRG